MSRLSKRFLTTTVVLVLLFASSTLYAFIIDVMPLVYANVLIAFGFAIVLSYIGYYGSYFWHCYTKKQYRVFVLGVVFIGWYFQWIQHILYVYLGNEGLAAPGNFFYLLINPIAFLQAVAEVYSFGTYSVFGIQITQEGLIPVWILELVILLLVPLGMMRKFPMPPYLPEKKQWFTKHQFTGFLNYVAAPSALKAELASEDAAAFEKLGKGYRNKYSEVYLFVLPDYGAAYITLWNVKYDRSGKNKDRDLLFNQLLISAEFAHELLKKYPNKKKWLSVPA